MPACKPLKPGQVALVANMFCGVFKNRNKALFLIACTTGFRAAELLSLTRADVMTSSGHLQDEITVKRSNMKGKKRSRSCRIHPCTAPVLIDWLRDQEQMGFDTPGIALWSKSNGGPISYHAYWKLLKNAFVAAGITQRGYATHTCRKTFAAEALKYLNAKFQSGEISASDPVSLICKLLGHADVRATMHYVESIQSEADAVLSQIGSDWGLDDLNQGEPQNTQLEA